MNLDPALVTQIAAHANDVIDQVVYVMGLKLIGQGLGHFICSLVLVYLARKLFKRYWTSAAVKPTPDLDMVATMVAGAVVTICSVFWFLASTPLLTEGATALLFPKGYAAIEALHKVTEIK